MLYTSPESKNTVSPPAVKPTHVTRTTASGNLLGRGYSDSGTNKIELTTPGDPDSAIDWPLTRLLRWEKAKCSLDTRDIPTPVSGSGEASPGVWPAGVFALPSTRHRPDAAHTGPGHTYGQMHEIVAIREQASSTGHLFPRASPASRRPRLGLQHIPRSPWLATGGIFWGASGVRPSRTPLQAAPP